MATPFDNLREQHNQLLEIQQDPKRTAELLVEAVEFVDQLQQSGSAIASPQERDQLRAILRYWSGYVYDREKNLSFLATDLLPYAGQPIFKRINIPGIVIFQGILILFLILSLAVFQFNATNLINSAPSTESFPTDDPSVSSISTLIAASTMTRQASAAIETQTTSPTPVLAPHLTITVTPVTSVIPPTAKAGTPESVSTTAAPAAPSFIFTNPINGAEIAPETLFQGTYQNLRPGWSIHVLLQPLSASGRYYPIPSFFAIPPNAPTGDWSITALIKDQFTLNKPDTYIATLIVANTDKLRKGLENAISAGLQTLPPEAIVIDNTPITLRRPAYRQINEVRLVYASYPTGTDSADLFCTLPDGSDQQQITYTTDLSEIFPSLSPDGKSIAFIGIRRQEGNPVSSLWIMDSSGANRKKLLEEPGMIYEDPVWSADGRYMAYSAQTAADKEQDLWNIYLYDTRVAPEQQAGIAIQQLTRSLTAQSAITSGRYPSWTPEGLIMFSSRTPGSEKLYSIDPKTMKLEEKLDYLNFFNHTGLVAQPRISPQGTQAAFLYVGSESGERRDIYIANLKTGAIAPLTQTPDVELYPRWAPDGKTVYYELRSSETPSIWAIATDGTAPRQITHPRQASDTTPTLGLMNAYLPVNQP